MCGNGLSRRCWQQERQHFFDLIKCEASKEGITRRDEELQKEGSGIPCALAGHVGDGPLPEALHVNSAYNDTASLKCTRKHCHDHNAYEGYMPSHSDVRFRGREARRRDACVRLTVEVGGGAATVYIGTHRCSLANASLLMEA